MSSQEDSTSETVDKRLFDEDGNVREDVAEAREAEEPQEEELTLESLRLQTANAMEQVDATFSQVGQQLRQMTEQFGGTVSDLHVRYNTLEELCINPDLQSDRQAFVDGRLTIDRLKEIATDIVVPAMKIEAETLRKQMNEKRERFQTLLKEGMSPEDAIKKIETEIEDDKPEEIKIVSG